MAEAKARVSPGSVPRSVMRYDPEPVGVQTAAWATAWAVSEYPAITPASLTWKAELSRPPGSVPRSATLKEPEAVGVQTAAWLAPVTPELPTTRPAALTPSA